MRTEPTLRGMAVPEVDSRLPGSANAQDDFKNALQAAEALARSGGSDQATEVPPRESPEGDALRDAFRDFVGQTFFGQMIQALRSTQQESEYFHGGQAERIFQAQFDQTLSERLSEVSAPQVADPMYELFQLGRST